MIETLGGAVAGAFAGYLFQRKHELDKNVVKLETDALKLKAENAAALATLSKGMEHIARELCGIRAMMDEERKTAREERQVIDSRLRFCETNIIEIKTRLEADG